MTSWAHWGVGWWLILDALATYRLTRLAIRDDITAPIRRRLIARYEGPLVTLVTCAWCLSVWMGASVVVFTYFVPLIWSWVAALLAFSAVAGWMSDREM